VDYLLRGQAVSVRILKAILRSGRIGHAYLFKGPAGSGKTALAKQFAKALLCLNGDSPEGLPSNSGTELGCNECPSCVRVDGDAHPDLIMIEKDGTSIGISAAHSMLKEVLTRPFVSKRKVFIIKDAETLTAEAANALLKLLEEPPAYVNFILTTANESAIPATVISRCQVIPLRAMPAEAVAAYLQEVHNVPEDRSRQIAALSDGSIQKAVWLLSQPDGQKANGEALTDKVMNGSLVELALEYSKADSGERQKLLAALQLEFAEKLSQAAMEYDKRQYGPDNSQAAVLKRNFEALKAIMRARQRLSANTNAFLVFCTLFMDMQRLNSEEI
jgi:DNA polymerase-3 subunit delta'